MALVSGLGALSIIHTRAHRWVSTPLQLVFWQVLLATFLLTLLVLIFQGLPRIDCNPRLVVMFLYGGVIGVALGYWAMAMVKHSLPAITTSLGILATPVVGVLASVVVLGEPLRIFLLVALVMIIGGIALGTIGGAQSRASAG